MTLFIACLVIFQLDMNPWLYAVAVVLWGFELLIRYASFKVVAER